MNLMRNYSLRLMKTLFIEDAEDDSPDDLPTESGDDIHEHASLIDTA